MHCKTEAANSPALSMSLTRYHVQILTLSKSKQLSVEDATKIIELQPLSDESAGHGFYSEVKSSFCVASIHRNSAARANPHEASEGRKKTKNCS